MSINRWMGKEVAGRSCSVMSNSLQPCGLEPTRLFCPWDFPSKNTGVGCHFLLQGILLTQGPNPCPPTSSALLVDSLPLSHQESPWLSYQKPKRTLKITREKYFMYKESSIRLKANFSSENIKVRRQCDTYLKWKIKTVNQREKTEGVIFS